MPRLAVLGQPVAHSRSPAMHAAALAELGLAGEWSYEAIEVAPADFEARVRAMPGEGFAGANVTVPHKLAALGLAGEASPVARAIGAANTLSFDGAVIAAENTDAAGLLAALGRPPAGLRALVLGAGGSARAVVWALTSSGAEVSVWNRTAERALRLIDDLNVSLRSTSGEQHQTSRPPIRHVPRPDASSFDLIVNATTVGLAGGAGRAAAGLKALPLDADSLKADQVVVDLVYGSNETELSEAARRRGAQVVDGLEVLVHQGAASLRIWTGQEPPIQVMRDAARLGTCRSITTEDT